ncbi:MAG: hypothetical protein JXX28_19395 [Deltaproteobacteria bacterium]|nr:hypothetical protein [Deltaproteobacteria bacterium]
MSGFEEESVVVAWSDLCPSADHGLRAVGLHELDDGSLGLTVRVHLERDGEEEPTRPYVALQTRAVGARAVVVRVQ